MRSSRFAALVAFMVLALPGAAVAAVPGAAAPLEVQSSSLSQQGQSLVWRLELQQPFSPQDLHRDGRSLCLLLERPATGSAVGEACITGPADRKTRARLLYRPITPSGPGTAYGVDASVSRTSSSELTASFLPAGVDLRYQQLRWQVISTLQPPACVQAPCEALFPARPVLLRLHTPRLVGCVPSGSPFATNGPRNRHVVALTFDDGPWYDTVQFLDVLERKHAVATFFEIGDQVATYGQGGAIERRMLADGDMIGDHTWNHADVAGGGSFAASEISQAAAAIHRATRGFEPCLFRAPGGAVSPGLISEARSMGFTTIQWDVDPRDWARPGTDAIYNTVVSNAHNGSIVLQHDGGGDRSETLAALPREIDTLRAKGYQFVTVTDLLGQRLIYK